jgi:hypothetical protein
MEISLAPRWWQKLGLASSLAGIGVLVAMAYIFDPPSQQIGVFSGQLVNVVTLENSKTGFRKIAAVKLSSGETVQAALPSNSSSILPAGARVAVRAFRSLIFRKRSYRVELIQLRPNNAFKPNSFRSTNSVAKRACHAVCSATRVGLT